jgi:hypothetical protein
MLRSQDPDHDKIAVTGRPYPTTVVSTLLVKGHVEQR